MKIELRFRKFYINHFSKKKGGGEKRDMEHNVAYRLC